MDAGQAKRYGMWSLNDNDQAARAHARLPRNNRQAGSIPQADKLNDFETSLLLYNYGLPINVQLSGASTSSNGQSVKCKTRSISSESADFVYEKASIVRYNRSHIGSLVDLNLDEVGPFKGVISSQDKEGFQVEVDADSKKVVASKLADLAASRGITHEVSIAAGPLITRIEPKNKNCDFDDHTGTPRKGIIVNISQVDALVRSRFIPPKPAIIIFKGPRRFAAEVSSVFAIGFFVKFCYPIPATEFSADLEFCDA